MDENKPASILVVDDIAENLGILKTILSAKRYEVRPLSSGELAVRAALSEVPDLILLDIMMPGMNGYEVCARLKADPLTRDVPVIFISALHDAEDKVRAFAAGGVDYVSKPFQVDEVLARVATHLHLHALQQALRTQNQQLQEAATLFEVSGEGIVLTDADGVIRRVNSAFTNITGFTADEVIGQTPRLFKSGHHAPEFYQTLWRELLSNGYWEGEIWNRHKNRSIVPQWETITAIRDHDGKVTGYVSQWSNITRRQLTEKEIRDRGNYDALTGLANRSLLLERLEMALKDHRRNGRRLSLLCISLDRFKPVNEAMGYIRGDLLLQQVAARLAAEIRDIDTAARIGGDEFVLMIVDQADYEETERLACRLLEALSQPFTLEEARAEIGVSIGIGLFPDDGDGVEIVLRNAMIAMSRAKEHGGRQVRFFTEAMGRELLERHRLEVDLKQALERGELELYYQPIVDLGSGQPQGVECLLRWQHPEFGAISPDTFIPIAESSGLIQAIGTWVIETACRQLGDWQRRGWVLYASVNVSTRQIPDGVHPDWLSQLVSRLGLEPESLVLEITESLFASEIESVAAWLKAVRALGFKVYLDDFGTGYSSLSYLKNFPVDTVKIDRAFVRDMVEQERDRTLIRAIMAMCHELSLQVVAEGIENAVQRQLLSDLDCAYGQGYLFSRPLPATELEAFLSRHET
ncbi:putative bifunctional diguanylate cyclase/phosphodiesterase [Thiorhodovibrio frisius]|uniref:PAS domain S-box/diguanylate cyclase (GGDEF) domain-containing protein n=1 Tax=Thiorhodovibrio frisius TaxID=631362 RepID=H8YYM8_9GAMM|nr:GGDEF domain-containing response regulator [Thiorhodovibrio frisius]EIC23554.1 PAS domain S-box/diguanylate cyclase (GGDEF) domain-containing protein [Thiorhodovibrio frisius]WPL23358.1 Bacteriophytochrome cph2 [Thiorhodovibrio frisius]